MPAARPDLTNAVWRKSSRSNPSGGDCVEVVDGIPGLVPVRDSKNPTGPALLFPATAWAAFVDDVKTAADRPRA
ncbi:DUF397 domain-containing protein [Streptomyces sp. H27-D2]|uniref:DUF397 domain-containing protein n=1 Tax=Streptomyces sp. H27-D2 TaxID=3046304 RepID=UPI002DBA8C0E|nr:DUF397 domain-containing protein [Streptomyces sp. H27-D2]MEC4019926.1 DUF397 domain-containing protein [Streptomyces sp. H27-D2]